MAKLDFIEKANLIHNYKYDYSLVNYVNAKTKVTIICPIHGVFEQTPDKHINAKHGCPICGLRVTKEDFLKKANLIHNYKYTYDLSNYKGVNTKVSITCPRHGVFFQKARKHLEGQNCPTCAARKPPTVFKEEIDKFYNNEISLVSEYVDTKTKVKIKCSKCGHISDRYPSDLLSGFSCFYCNSSKLEKVVENILVEKNIFFTRNKTFDDLKDDRLLSYDFYIEEKNLLIECQGKQHYKPVKYFGGTKGFHKQLHHDWLKRKYAKKNGFKLLILPYWEFSSFKKNNIQKKLVEEL